MLAKRAAPSARPGQPSPEARRRALFSLIIAALLFSAMALLAKSAARRLPGPEVACLRFLFGLLAVAAAPLFGRPLRPRNWTALLMRGAFGGGAVLLYFLALAHLPAGVATLLNYSSPIFTVLFSALFLGERLPRLAWLALLLTCVGVYLTVQGGSYPAGHDPATSAGLQRLSLRSAALPYLVGGVISAVLSGAAVTTIRGMRHSEGSWEIFGAFCLIGALMTAVPTAVTFVMPDRTEWLLASGVGLSSVVAQLLMTHALRDVNAGVAGILLQITPVATLLGGGFLLGEHLTLVGLLGAGLALCGVSLGMLRPS